MPYTRRAFLRHTLLSGGALATAACTMDQRPNKAAHPGPDGIASSTTATDALRRGGTFAWLQRASYGVRSQDLERLESIGLAAYLDEQLTPAGADPDLDARLAALLLPIQYEAEGRYPATDERRPLAYLGAPLSTLWPLSREDEAIPWSERIRPLEEVRAATMLRAVYSRWQLRELLVEHWHNHFSVNAENDDLRITITMPIYDREVIRTHALGNFRQLLEAVATSTAMLSYLDNASSKASPANENYARELLELHTLGAAHYFNDRYQRWGDVPGAAAGAPAGYIDADVYEAARAFTGWSVADGRDLGEDDTLPDTGEFVYIAAWHDPYQKRVLATELAPNQPALADGRAVLDMLARHPATALHVCTRLCRRLIADDPPPELVARAAAVFRAQIDAPDQIAQTVRAILSAPEALAPSSKVRRPYEVLVAFLRATAAEVQPDENLHWLLFERGYRMFSWPAPNGHPDVADPWLSTNVMIGRWNMLVALTDNWWGTTTLDLTSQTPAEHTTAAALVAYWSQRLLGTTLAPDAASAIASAYDETSDLDALVCCIAMAPEFHQR